MLVRSRRSVPSTILMRVDVLSAVQTKHGRRIWTESSSGEKQEREAGERLLSVSGLLPKSHQPSGCHLVWANLSNVVAAVCTGREGEATQLHRLWASRSWHQSRVLWCADSSLLGWFIQQPWQPWLMLIAQDQGIKTSPKPSECTG